MKITAVILTYNESPRIRIALSHALIWADEVCVVDKLSTDNTREIAESMGAKVFTIPFSKQGHENVSDVLSFAANDWTWIFTPGEVPTQKIIERAREAICDEVDCVYIPHKLYSFGEHSLFSPWSISMQPRLLCRNRVEFTGIAHDPIVAKKIRHIPYFADCYVLHQTHATAATFIGVHGDYAINEASNGTASEVLERAMKNYVNYDEKFMLDKALSSQWLGWKIYWLMVALHATERKSGKNVPEEYEERAKSMMRSEWAGSCQKLTAAPESVRV